jgi:hypothetical protein
MVTWVPLGIAEDERVAFELRDEARRAIPSVR